MFTMRLQIIIVAAVLLPIQAEMPSECCGLDLQNICEDETHTKRSECNIVCTRKPVCQNRNCIHQEAIANVCLVNVTLRIYNQVHFGNGSRFHIEGRRRGVGRTSVPLRRTTLDENSTYEVVQSHHVYGWPNISIGPNAQLFVRDKVKINHQIEEIELQDNSFLTIEEGWMNTLQTVTVAKRSNLTLVGEELEYTSGMNSVLLRTENTNCQGIYVGVMKPGYGEGDCKLGSDCLCEYSEMDCCKRGGEVDDEVNQHDNVGCYSTVAATVQSDNWPLSSPSSTSRRSFLSNTCVYQAIFDGAASKSYIHADKGEVFGGLIRGTGKKSQLFVRGGIFRLRLPINPTMPNLEYMKIRAIDATFELDGNVTVKFNGQSWLKEKSKFIIKPASDGSVVGTFEDIILEEHSGMTIGGEGKISLKDIKVKNNVKCTFTLIKGQKVQIHGKSGYLAVISADDSGKCTTRENEKKPIKWQQPRISQSSDQPLATEATEEPPKQKAASKLSAGGSMVIQSYLLYAM